MIKILKAVIIVLLFSINIQAQRSITALRIENQLKIDGILDEADWQRAQTGNEFVQMEPYNKAQPTRQSEIKVLYDDRGLYIGAWLWDNPDSIKSALSERDDDGNSDNFGVTIDPFNDGIKAFGFILTAAGVQIDIMYSGNSEDSDWDAVWYSAVSHSDDGWFAEILIPYSALRFSNTDNQAWGFNAYRNIERNRELSTWNYIDIEQDGFLNQAGQLVGIDSISPPLRFSLTPYFSTYFEKQSDISEWGYSLKGGMDLKYGLSESFTLDMMLIPDFGQVQSDDRVLNLSPFEVYYSENRGFFKEGTELFNRAGIFYSRRIGSKPRQHDHVYGLLDEHESVETNPTTGQLINATKITGKTNSGISVGFLNAMSLQSVAVVRDSVSDATREIVTQPFTNYNVSVIEKALANNSYISLVNTHVNEINNHYNSNVTGGEMKLNTGDNAYSFFVAGAYNHNIIEEDVAAENGFYYATTIEKTKGNFRFRLYNGMESERYDPNALGFLSSPNEINYQGRISYNIYEPFWNLLSVYNSLSVGWETLAQPNLFSENYISYSSRGTFKNHLSVGLGWDMSLTEENDHYESRVWGRIYKKPPWQSGSVWFSSDYSKTVALDGRFGGFWATTEPRSGIWWRVAPRWRIGNRILLIYALNNELTHNDYGFVAKSEDDSHIYFGQRDRQTISSVLTGNYIFTNKAALSIRARHYRATVQYIDYYQLDQQGYLNTYTGEFENKNQNFNAFNVDMVFSWQFLPGSELSLAWKNAISSSNNNATNGYMESLLGTFEATQHNNLSLKILYYVDYQNIRTATQTQSI